MIHGAVLTGIARSFHTIISIVSLVGFYRGLFDIIHSLIYMPIHIPNKLARCGVT